MNKIKLCIDARVLQFESNGISRYLRENVYNLCCYDNIEIFLISNRKILIDKSLLSNNVHIIEDIKRTSIPGTVWLHVFMNGFLDSIKPNIYWGPNQILPFNKLKDIKYIVTAHDLVHVFYPETMTFLNKMIFNLSYGRSIKYADKILAISETTRNDFIKVNGIEFEDKIQTIYLGGAEKFQRNSLFEDKEDKSIFILGSLEPRKNIAYFLDVLEEALKLDPEIKLYITGAEKWKSKDIVDRINSDIFKSNVFLLGYLTDQEIENYLNKSKLFVFPSVYEGFGLPLVEAQDKLLILASKIPVFEELSKSFENLFFLDLDQSIQFNAAQIVSLLENNNISKLKDNCYDLFTWKNSANELRELLLDLNF